MTNVPGAQIAADYEAKRGDAWRSIEELAIAKRFISTCKNVAFSLDSRILIIYLQLKLCKLSARVVEEDPL